MASCMTCGTPRPRGADARRPEEGCRPTAGGRAAAGSNRIIELFSARRFDFGGLQASGTAELVVAEHLDVSADAEARLYLRNHGSAIGSGASIEVVLYADAPSPEDPALVFRAPTPLDSLSITTEILRTVAITEGLGSAVTVAVRGTQGTTVVDCNAVLSADLAVKRRPDDGGRERIAAVPRTTLDHTALAPSTSAEQVLVEALDVREHRNGFVALRVHDRSIGTGADITVHVHHAFPDPDDPAAAFVEATPAATFVIGAGTTSELHTLRLPPGFGPYSRVRAVATQSTSGGDLEATVSVEFTGGAAASVPEVAV